jgi:amino acid adenylation domain-containing protein
MDNHGMDNHVMGDLKMLLAENQQPADLVPFPRTGDAPLSFGQERLWFLDQWGLSGSAYNMPPVIYCLKGKLNSQAARQSIGEIVRRHEILRTRFTSKDGIPSQTVDSAETFRLESYDLSRYGEADQRSEIERLTRADAAYTYDLAAGPLFKVSLLSLGPCEHLLVFSAHHIISDGWSQDIILHEFMSLYEAFADGLPSPLPDLPVQYADFAIWQRARDLTPHLVHWVSAIAGYEGRLALPYDHNRPRRRSWRAETIFHRFPESLARDVTRFSAAHRLTPFMTFLTALFIVLNRYTGRSDLCIATSIAGRDHAHLELMAGFFMNVLPLRVDMAGDPAGEEILRRVRDTSIEAMEHQELPFEHLLNALMIERDQSHVALVPVMARHQNWPTRAGIIGRKVAGMEVHPFRLDVPDIEFPQMAKCELDFVLYGRGADLQVGVEYAADLFERSTIVRWTEHCEHVLRELIENPTLCLSRFTLTEQERRVRPSVDRNRIPGPGVVELFERQARSSPAAIACIEGEHRLTYAELNDRVNQVANALLGCGVGREALVGICLERSTSFLACLLGIFRAGGAYVPLDPTYPAAYLRQIVVDAAPCLIITTAELRHLLPESSRILDLETIASQQVVGIPISAHPDQLAYVTYTSGSTGKPKGVMVPHRQILNWLLAMWERSPFGSGEVVAQKTSANFVVSIKEMLGGLLKGAPVAFLPDAAVKDADAFVAILERHRVTRLNIVPSHLAALIEGMKEGGGAFRCLKYCITAGEPLTRALQKKVKQVMPWLELWNNYGCTELNDVTYCGPEDQNEVAGYVPIGLPIAGMRTYVLDPDLRMVPAGAIGELCVEGADAARGYLGQPALTAARFIAHPYSDEPGMRLYRTGDLVSVGMDGKLSYFGREDFEVKVRGHRIDIRHVEQTLLGYPGIEQAVVHALSPGQTDAQLVAYYACATPKEPSPGELRGYLADELPDYMIPVFFISLGEFPRLPNGKLNRRALPLPDLGLRSEGAYEAPKGEIEQALAEIWKELLNVERIGRHDDFFRLGGHSLLAMRLFQRVNDSLRISLPVYTLFDAPTIEGMAQFALRAIDAAALRDPDAQVLTIEL